MKMKIKILANKIRLSLKKKFIKCCQHFKENHKIIFQKLNMCFNNKSNFLIQI